MPLSLAFRRQLVLIAFVCLVRPQCVWGQASQSSPLPGLDSMAFVRLQGLLSAQRRIRVSLVHDDRILYGPRLTYTTLMADSSPGQWAPSVNLSAVRVIAVPRSRAGRFALEGSVAGGTLGLVGGLLSQAQIFCDHSGGSSGSFSLFGPCRPFDGGKVAWTTVETAAIGAILGAAIGAIGREWRAVYAAPGNERRIP